MMNPQHKSYVRSVGRANTMTGFSALQISPIARVAEDVEEERGRRAWLQPTSIAELRVLHADAAIAKHLSIHLGNRTITK